MARLKASFRHMWDRVAPRCYYAYWRTFSSFIHLHVSGLGESSPRYAVCCLCAVLKCGQWQDGQRGKDAQWCSVMAECGCWVRNGSRYSWLWEQLFSDLKATLLLAMFQDCEISIQCSFLLPVSDVLIASFSVTSMVSELHLSCIITDFFLMWGHASLYIQPFAGLLLGCNCIGFLIEFLGLLSQHDCKNLCCIECGLDYLPIKVQGKHNRLL